MKLLGLLVLVLVPLAAACGAGSSPRTELTFLAVNPFVGRSVFHLECGPAGGDVADPARACAALAAAPGLVTRPKTFGCIGGTFSWWKVWVRGRLDGAPIRRSFATCWTPQAATLGRLGLASGLDTHLEPRRHRTLSPGTTRVFPRGELRPGDAVACTARGHTVEEGVQGTTSEYFLHGPQITVAVTLRPAGSVRASCRVKR